MFTQELNRYKPPPKPKGKKGKRHYVAGSEEHRAYIHRGAVQIAYHMGFDHGTTVKTIMRPIRNGVIINIENDIQSVEWDGMKCKPVEVYIYGEELEMFHPDELEVA